MPDLIDSLSRILATNMARPEKLRLIRSTIDTMGTPGLFWQGGVRMVDNKWPWRAPKRLTRLNVAETAAKLRLAYLARNSFVYRMEVFSALLTLRHADGTELEQNLKEIIDDIGEHGADGVETLVLACADGVVIRGDDQTKGRALASLESIADRPKFWSAAPPPNLKIPLSRVSSYLVLDVRPDAMRELLILLVRLNQDRHDLQSLLDLLNWQETRDALCNLPALPNQTGDISNVDAARQESCDTNDSAGSPQDGTVKGALRDLASTGCGLMTNDEVATMIARVEAMEDCFEERDPGRPLPTLGPVAAAAFAVLVDVLIEVGAWALDKGLERVERQREYNRALEDAGDAMRDAVEAAKEAEEAGEDLADAEASLEFAEEQLRQAEEALDNATTDAERREAREWVNEARQAVKDGQKAVKDATRRKEEADEAAKDAENKAREEADEAEEKRPEGDALDPEDAFDSPACKEAMGDPTDTVVSERLGKDWTAWNKTRGGELPHIWDPAPEDLQPYDAFRLPFCGSDDATVNNRADGCGMPVECLEGTPDESCECNGAPTDEARLVATIAASACRDVHCPDGSNAIAQGLVCVCAEQPVEEGNPGRPPGPTPPVLAALFESEAAATPDRKFTTLGLVHSLFHDLGASRNGH